MRKVDPAVLRDDYERLGGCLSDVAKLHGVHEWTVWDNLRRHHPEVLKHGFKGKIKPNAEQLRMWYWDEGKSLNEIAELCGTRAATILLWMKKNGIPNRSRSEANKVFRTEGAFEPSREVLERMYISERKSVKQICDECGTTRYFVEEGLKRHGISKRPNLATQVACGDVVPIWSGYKVGRLTFPDGKEIAFQSSYEKEFLEQCARGLVPVSRWTKLDAIPYTFGGKKRLYFPDYVCKSEYGDVVVEIKSGSALSDLKTQEKVRAGFYFFRDKGIPYRLLTEIHLGIHDSHSRQSRTKLREWAEKVERAGDEPFLKFLWKLEESHNSPTKPRLSEWLFGDEDVR